MKHIRAKTLEEKFLALVDKQDDHWIWKGSVKENGCVMRHRGKNYKARRVSFGLEFGEVPDGYFVFSKCDNEKCVNPHHLDVMTQSLHTQIHNKKMRENPVCKAGHEFSKFGSEEKSGRRKCLECARLRMKKYRAEKK